ncbi:hypothetical protein [Methylobacterium crusticola]|nr:hypothetical protein [Methylobacterium crusticola]
MTMILAMRSFPPGGPPRNVRACLRLATFVRFAGGVDAYQRY